MAANLTLAVPLSLHNPVALVNCPLGTLGGSIAFPFSIERTKLRVNKDSQLNLNFLLNQRRSFAGLHTFGTELAVQLKAGRPTSRYRLYR